MYYYPGYARLPSYRGAHGKQGINSCRYPFTTPGLRETIVDKMPCLGAQALSGNSNPGSADYESRARTDTLQCISNFFIQFWPHELFVFFFFFFFFWGGGHPVYKLEYQKHRLYYRQRQRRDKLSLPRYSWGHYLAATALLWVAARQDSGPTKAEAIIASPRYPS